MTKRACFGVFLWCGAAALFALAGCSRGLWSSRMGDVAALSRYYQQNVAARKPVTGMELQKDFASALARVKQAPAAGASTWLALGEKLQKEHGKSTLSLRSAGTTSTSSGDTNPDKGGSTDEIGNKLNNPGSDLASLNFKLNWDHFTGDRPGGSSQDSFAMTFQPVLPFKLDGGGNFLVRPSIPLVWRPNFNTVKSGFDEQFGLGDSQLVAFYARTEAKKGYMWGIGTTMQFPTHTDDVLGNDQFQIGPAAYAGLMGKWGSVGVFPQHFWNIGGTNEGYTALTIVQPWYWFSLGKGWQVGGSPNIAYDWAQDDYREAWTVPVNLGVSKTIKIGQTPVKLKLEGIYYIVQPDTFGPQFGLQLTITPVVSNPFSGLFKK